MRERISLIIVAAILLGAASAAATAECPEPPDEPSPARREGFDLRYPHVPGEVLVVRSQPLAPELERAREETRQALFRQLELTRVEDFNEIRATRLRIRSPASEEVLGRVGRQLDSHRDLFVSVDPNYCVYLEPLPEAALTASTSAKQWALDKIEARAAWNHSTGSSKVVVGVIDSGIETQHPAFKNRLWKNPGETDHNGIDDDGNGKVDDVHGWNFVDDDENLEPSDSNDRHGTEVAGIIGAIHDPASCIQGLNQDVRLMVLKVGRNPAVADVAKALLYAHAFHAPVVNASLSTAVNGTLRAAIEAAANETVVVAAAGHGGSTGVNLDDNPRDPCSSGLPNVVCVTATTESDGLEAHSSWGPNTVHLGGPGEGVLTTTLGGKCRKVSRSSIAAPHVAGVAALIKGRTGCKNATVAQVIDRLLDGDPAADLSGKTRTGKRLNALKAVKPTCP